MGAFFTALFLGFIEGLTEFLPVSSTAHLLLLTEALEFSGPPGHVFEIFIQIGAIFAVVVLYRKKLWATAIGLPSDPKARHFFMTLVIGTIPALIAGALCHSFIKVYLYNPYVIATALIGGGILMLFIEKNLKKANVSDINSVSYKMAFFVGCCQAVALIPGISRSGASIVGGLTAGLTRPAAAEFSFFLAIPVMFAAVAYDILKSWHDIMDAQYLILMLAGLVSAFVTAMIVIRLALWIVNRYGFVPFAWYRIIAGIIVLCVMAMS